MTHKNVEFGIDSFADISNDAQGNPVAPGQVVRNVVEEAVLADEVGVDYLGLGEHHRSDYAISSPDMVLANIAGRTTNLRLSSSVTVLSSDDPVRVWERYATLAALSNGRAEIIVGRGSFTESFPLFGFSLDDYGSLFEEKLDLLDKLRTQQPVTWEGTFTQSLNDVTLHPELESDDPLPMWVAVGGNPESAIRAARHGLPIIVAVLNGPHARFAPIADRYRQSLAEFGKPSLPVGFQSSGFIAETDDQAKEQFFEPWRDYMTKLGRERGWMAPSRAQFELEIAQGSLFVGSPESVAGKLAKVIELLDAGRVTIRVSTGVLSHELIMKSVELYGTQVIPRVRELLG